MRHRRCALWRTPYGTNKLRVQLIQLRAGRLRHIGPTLDLCCHKLAKHIAIQIRHFGTEAADRNYSNVHTDVARLEQLGLIERNEDAAISVPYEAVEIVLPLAQVA